MSREDLLSRRIEISRQMAIKFEESRNTEYTPSERQEAQIEYHRLQEVLLQVEWKLEAV